MLLASLQDANMFSRKEEKNGLWQSLREVIRKQYKWQLTLSNNLPCAKLLTRCQTVCLLSWSSPEHLFIYLTTGIYNLGSVLSKRLISTTWSSWPLQKTDVTVIPPFRDFHTELECKSLHLLSLINYALGTWICGINRISWLSWKPDYCWPFCVTSKETEAQRDKVLCSESQGWQLVGLGHQAQPSLTSAPLSLVKSPGLAEWVSSHLLCQGSLVPVTSTQLSNSWKYHEKNHYTGGWGCGSISKALGTQAWGPEFGPIAPMGEKARSGGTNL